MRWFSTFTQRSLGEAEEVELAPRPSSTPSAASWLNWRRWRPRRRAARRPSLAEILPLERFGAPLNLVPDSAVVILAATEEIEPALRDHWEDATTAMHAEDARRLYVDVAEPLAARAALALSAAGGGRTRTPFAPRAPSPRPATSGRPRASCKSWSTRGYRTVVAFDSLGEAERTRYGLDRLDTSLLDGASLSPEPGLSFAEGRLREGFISPELRIAVFPFRRLVHRRRAAEQRAPGTGRGRPRLQ